MYGANQNLEYKIKDKTAATYRSAGERKIAYFFDNNAIKYQYEPAVLVNTDNNRSRIWYPDFYLPEFKTYLEYFGLAGQPGYDDGIKKKLSTYSKMGLDVISLYPWMFKEDWKGYIMKELETNTIRQYRNLMAKPYWSQRNAFTDRIKTAPHYGYRKNPIRLYLSMSLFLIF
jgi:hypothetical protein